LANAVMQNKKILVASKNNQAVDNVKSRFERDNNSGFFLRFGNKQILENTTLPDINKISVIKPDLEDNSIQIKIAQDKLNEKRKVKSENKRKLELRNELQRKLPELTKLFENLNIEIQNLSSQNPLLELFRINHQISTIDTYSSQLKKSKNTLELKYSGLGKLWFDWFKKRKIASEFLNSINEFPIEFRNYFKNISLPNQIEEFRNGTVIINAYKKTIDSLESIINYINNYTKKDNELKKNQQEIATINNKIAEINANEQEIRKTIASCEDEIIKLSKIVLKEKIENKLFNASLSHINNYKDYLPNNIPWRYEEISQFENTTKNFLEIFNINCVTSLSAKASLPLTTELFDMVIIDEASQCDIASAIPLILRAKQLVVIGDPLQLKHISALNKFEEEKIKEHLQLSSSVYLKYKEKSLWDYSESFLANAKNNSTTVNIDKHYRCHPEIIGYSNEAFYIPKRNLNLEICTNENQFQITPKGMIWEDVVGTQRADNININDAEIAKSIEIATKIANSNPNISIGIVTPFRHQAIELHNKIPVNLKSRIVADTVYKFQGDEKDIMIFSLVVTNNSPNSKIHWIDNVVPESVNVAITRARNTIYIVGNKEYIKSKSTLQKPLGKLVDYAGNLN
ncbi:MAG: DEAD/DEAH box helicase, partial [bacterium]|nr:DEAD/DEAH box helicase [bacterium]